MESIGRSGCYSGYNKPRAERTGRRWTDTWAPERRAPSTGTVAAMGDGDDGGDDVGGASLALFASRIVTQAIGFAALVYYARELGAAALGVFFTFETLVAVLGITSEFGVSGAVTKRMSQATSGVERGRYLTGAFALACVPFGVVTVGVVAFGRRLVDYVGLPEVVPLLVLVLAVNLGAQVLISALRGERRVAVTAWVGLAGQLVRVAVSVGLLLAGFGPVALVYGIAAASITRSATAFGLLDTAPALPSLATVRSLFDFSKYTAGMEASDLAYNWADTLVLAAFASKAVVGTYETAWKLSFVSLLAANVIGIALAPSVTNWHEAGETEKVAAAFRHGVTYSLLFVIPAVAGAAVLGDEVLHALYGFSAGAAVLLVLLVGQLAQAVKNVSQNVLFGVNRPETVFWTNLVTVGANVLLNLALVPRFGAIGAAFATLATATVAAAGQLYALRSSIPLSVDARAVGWQVAVAGVVAAVLLLARPHVEATTAGVFALAGLAVAVYGAGVLAHGGMRERLLGATPWG